jgi:hypothetical protein
MKLSSPTNKRSRPFFNWLVVAILAAASQNLFAQLVDGQPKNETQISARRENFPANGAGETNLRRSLSRAKLT